jgi:hypothetical protein
LIGILYYINIFILGHIKDIPYNSPKLSKCEKEKNLTLFWNFWRGARIYPIFEKSTCRKTPLELLEKC